MSRHQWEILILSCALVIVLMIQASPLLFGQPDGLRPEDRAAAPTITKCETVLDKGMTMGTLEINQ